MKPYFSIVMPAYHAEEYIREAIKGIQRQTYLNWELIIINDASKDRTKEVIEEFAKEDVRIRLINHDENLGVSKARNRGIEEAAGTYLWFVDADDYVETNLLELVVLAQKKNQAKLVMFGHVEEYYDEKGNYVYSNPIFYQDRDCYYKDAESLRKEIIYLEQKTMYGYAWNKIYEIQYLKERRLLFEDYKKAKFIEDILFNITYCMDIDSMNVLSACPYHYGKRTKDNLTNEFAADYFKFHQKRIESLLEQFRYWNMDTHEVRRVLGSLYARYILSALQRNCDKRSGMNHVARYKWCKGLFSKGLFNELVPEARVKDSKVLALLLVFLRWKKVVICLAYGRAVHIVKSKLPMICTKVKSKR